MYAAPVPVTAKRSISAAKKTPAEVSKASKAVTKPGRIKQTKQIVDPDSASDLSDLDDEEEELSVDMDAEEEDDLSSLAPSESEHDLDDTSDYEESGKKKKGKRVVRIPQATS